MIYIDLHLLVMEELIEENCLVLHPNEKAGLCTLDGSCPVCTYVNM